MASAPEPHPSSAEMAELSALADGTLDPARRAAVETRIGASPQLSARLARERAVIARLAQARAEDRAPQRLRARIDAARPARATVARRRAGAWSLAAGALAAAVLALALAVPAGTPGAPSVSEAAALAQRGATAPAPALDPRAPAALLAARVQRLAFPNWGPSFGWRAVGARQDRLGGRQVLTVYYAGPGGEVAYSIVSTPALRSPATRGEPQGGYYLHTLRLHGRTVVTWQRAGHTCILSAAHVPGSVLRDLAAWRS